MPTVNNPEPVESISLGDGIAKSSMIHHVLR